MRTKLLLLIAISLLPLQALAWGATGHQLVCAMAEQQLTPAARRWLNALLADGSVLDRGSMQDGGSLQDKSSMQDNSPVLSFADACLWPDTARNSTHIGSYEQHFINVQASATSIDLARDCPAMDCNVIGIRRSLVYLAQPTASSRERARQAAALRFLAHFIGDLHQPLHVGHPEDWGGNKIRVKWLGEATNLHAVWDSKMIEHAGMTYPASLQPLLQQASQETDTSVAVMPWLTASLKLARERAYRDQHGTIITNGTQLGEAYQTSNAALINTQLILAGQRLANLINQLADGTLTVANIPQRVFGE